MVVLISIGRTNRGREEGGMCTSMWPEVVQKEATRLFGLLSLKRMMKVPGGWFVSRLFASCRVRKPWMSHWVVVGETVCVHRSPSRSRQVSAVVQNQCQKSRKIGQVIVDWHEIRENRKLLSSAENGRGFFPAGVASTTGKNNQGCKREKERRKQKKPMRWK